MRCFPILIAAGTATLAVAGPIAKSYGSSPFPDSIARRNGGSGFQYFGLNEAGAEFGAPTLPGQLGKHYIWPSTRSLDVGMNLSKSLISVLTDFLDLGWPRPQYLQGPILDGAVESWLLDWTPRSYLPGRPHKGTLRYTAPLPVNY